MNKLAYIKYSQEEANQKIWNSLMDKYELLKKKNSFLAHLWVPLACILFGFVAIFSWISFLTLLFKDIQFTPHYMRTVIKYNNMSKEEEKEYLDNQFSEYKNRVSYGNLSTEKQSQINTTFDLLFKVNTDKFDKIPEPELQAPAPARIPSRGSLVARNCPAPARNEIRRSQSLRVVLQFKILKNTNIV